VKKKSSSSNRAIIQSGTPKKATPAPRSGAKSSSSR
jgi:hypothetical protein